MLTFRLHHQTLKITHGCGLTTTFQKMNGGAGDRYGHRQGKPGLIPGEGRFKKHISACHHVRGFGTLGPSSRNLGPIAAPPLPDAGVPGTLAARCAYLCVQSARMSLLRYALQDVRDRRGPR
ncbi:hypothetical protein EVAR_106_1 [Eumeta japonica]|uniref:Uncharacterized protein n=1 Tax=Eumeta variegata TaxID=151549 RepID=A0A4C1SAS8_EUMVA|nr:hypothetical protein EVAR_106_1 [Eumeta japonica]